MKKKTKANKPAICSACKTETTPPAPAPIVTPKGKLFLGWHLGLGDAIICNGMVRTLLDRYEIIMLPVKPRNMRTVQFMFRDMRPVGSERIQFCPSMDDVELARQGEVWRGNGYEILPIGLHRDRKNFDFGRWDQALYEQAGVPFQNRWSRFYVQRELEKEIKIGVTTYAFIHREQARGYNFNPKNLPKGMHLVEATHVDHLFMWAGAIENATELHFIDSAPLCLADSLTCKAAVKTLHKYARNSTPPKLTDGWKVM